MVVTGTGVLKETILFGVTYSSHYILYLSPLTAFFKRSTALTGLGIVLDSHRRLKGIN